MSVLLGSSTNTTTTLRTSSLFSKVVNRGINPLLNRLPEKFETYRPGQVQAILETMAALEDSDVVVLDAPTGSGKTLIAESVRLLTRSRGLYVCHSKGLQDQFAGDFGYSRVVKGRVNYATELYPRRFPVLSADDCTWKVEEPDCAWCTEKPSCPYELAKHAALKADVAVLNSTYALTEWNGPGAFSGRELVVLDEADTFEHVLRDWLSCDVSRRRMEKFGWTPPKVTVAASWQEWLDEKLPILERVVAETEDEKEHKTLDRLYGQLSKVRQALVDGLPFAFTGREGAVGWKPAVIAEYCKEAVWKHGTKWLLMSATTISPSNMLKELGCTKSSRTVKLGSTFPSHHRPVVVKKVTSMARSQQTDASRERLAQAICDEVDDESGRVLVHTVSHDLARDLSGRMVGKRGIYTYGLASDRSGAISKWQRSSDGILLAASADRGFDFPDDQCRLIIIAKVPYPNLGDRMVSMRAHMGRDGQTWYDIQTVRAIVQMAGRGMRHKEDYCRTVILDSQFTDQLWYRAGYMFPSWFREAMTWETTSNGGRNRRPTA